ncbi:MAG: hypothetical protein IK090_04405, partial [Clostridia bacterium]|nr:hypothetical protein [Clostridia bacterium]
MGPAPKAHIVSCKTERKATLENRVERGGKKPFCRVITGLFGIASAGAGLAPPRLFEQFRERRFW